MLEKWRIPSVWPFRRQGEACFSEFQEQDNIRPVERGNEIGCMDISGYARVR